MTDNILQVRGLKKTYGGEKKKGIKGLTPKLDVLRGIDIDIQRGDVICLVGPSGCGKSTFLRCLNRLEIPTEGTVTFEGEEVNDKDIDRIRRKMGMVFQHFNLFPHMTVKQNLCMAPVLLKLKSGRTNCWPGWVCRKRRMCTPTACPAARSSALPLPVPWPWTRT